MLLGCQGREHGLGRCILAKICGVKDEAVIQGVDEQALRGCRGPLPFDGRQGNCPRPHHRALALPSAWQVAPPSQPSCIAISFAMSSGYGFSQSQGILPEAGETLKGLQEDSSTEMDGSNMLYSTPA